MDTVLENRQIRCTDAGAQPSWRALQASHLFGEQLAKAREIIGDAIRQTAFELCPDELIRIEFRSIPWKKVMVDPWMLVQELFDHAGSMCAAPVPQQDDGSWNMPQEVPKEQDNFLRADVLVGMKPEIETHAPSLWRKTDGRDGRDFCPDSCHTE
jgi:hypothetical protein